MKACLLIFKEKRVNKQTVNIEIIIKKKFYVFPLTYSQSEYSFGVLVTLALCQHQKIVDLISPVFDLK